MPQLAYREMRSSGLYASEASVAKADPKDKLRVRAKVRRDFTAVFITIPYHGLEFSEGIFSIPCN
jgi:hypothetical protein